MLNVRGEILALRGRLEFWESRALVANRVEPADTLTRREFEIAGLVSEGLTNGQIAGRLNLSRATVATHVSRSLQKLGYRTRSQVAVWMATR